MKLTPFAGGPTLSAPETVCADDDDDDKVVEKAAIFFDLTFRGVRAEHR